MEKTNDGVDRREFLKTTSAAGAGAIAVGRVRAVPNEQTDRHVGSVQFVEATLEHRDAPETPRLATDGRAAYAVDEGRGRLTLAGAPLDRFEDGSVVLYDGAYRTMPTRSFDASSTHHLTVQSDFRRIHETKLELESTYDGPDISFETADDGSVCVTAEGRPTTIPAGHERRTKLSPRTVDVRGESRGVREVPNPRDVGPATVERPAPGPVESATVTPSLTVRNHGTLDVHGTEGAWVLPVGTDDQYTRNTVRSMLQTSDHATIDSADDLLVVPVGGERR